MKYLIVISAILIFLVIGFTACENAASPNKSKEFRFDENGNLIDKNKADTSYSFEEVTAMYPYDYFDTNLSNGYSLGIRYQIEVKDSFICKCLVLQNEFEIIDTLNCMGLGAIDKNLGYIGADFTSYFAFVNSFGSGNPHYTQLIRKQDGKEMIAGYFLARFKNLECLLLEIDTIGVVAYMVKDTQAFLLPLATQEIINNQFTFSVMSELEIQSIKNGIIKLNVSSEKYEGIFSFELNNKIHN